MSHSPSTSSFGKGLIAKLTLALTPLAVLIALPLLSRPKAAEATPSDDKAKLVIITPHNETIRYEFERAFRKHFRETRGRDVHIEWRMPGGTSDIVRYIDDKFAGAFRDLWESNPDNGPWTAEVAKNFNNRKLDPSGANVDPLPRKAREAFLSSNAGIGVDLFFGGGQYEMNKQARKGHAIDAGMLTKHPEWFNDDVIPLTFSGETFYDSKGRYYGTCLSSFGLCYNVDRVKLLPDGEPPRRWSDLGKPELIDAVVVADPTKSGSITKCFEMLMQQSLAEAVGELGEERGLPVGWRNGLNLIKRIGGNAWTVTDSASKVPRDVGKGNAAAGMCIDFYGRAESEWSAWRNGGKPRLLYVTPESGSSMSCDPIMMFRGAPNPEAAKAFIEFVLSKDGQRLWNYRPGEPGGPEKYALRRLPVRKDLYKPEDLKRMSDPDALPFERGASFDYHGRWTGPYFSLLRVLIKCMALDPLDELRAAWRAIQRAGGPEQCPEAMKAFNRLPFGYDQCGKMAGRLRGGPGDSKLAALETQRQWSEFFRQNYLEAAELAKRERALQLHRDVVSFEENGGKHVVGSDPHGKN